MINKDNKSFKINSNDKNNYNINRFEIKELLCNIKLGYNTMVMGPFKSGKTATLYSLISSLGQGYYSLRVSFPNSFDISISSYFGKYLNYNVNHLIKFDNELESIVGFKEVFKNSRVVILLDDFHNVIGKKDIQQFLLMLKGLRDDPNCSIHSIVIFGNYDLFKITSLLDRFNTLSPISFESTIFLTNINKEDTLYLFGLWSIENKVSISDELLNELWLLSNGNIHLIGIIGVVLTKIYEIENCTKFSDRDVLKKLILELIKQQQQYCFLKSYIYKTSTLPDILNSIISNDSNFNDISYNDLIVLSNFGLFYYKDSKFHLSAPILVEYLFDKSPSLVL